jgi:hypothetical protein
MIAIAFSTVTRPGRGPTLGVSALVTISWEVWVGSFSEHSLVKPIEGVKTEELNAFMRNVERAALPTVEQAKEHYQERKIAGLEADRATLHAEMQWEEALGKAAIAQEEKQRQFVEPKETRSRRQQGKEQQPARAERPLNEAAADIRLAFAQSKPGRVFKEPRRSRVQTRPRNEGRGRAQPC